MDSEVTLYAVVSFVGERRDSAEVVVMFEDVSAAEGFAGKCRLDSYLVAPVVFHLGAAGGLGIVASVA